MTKTPMSPTPTKTQTQTPGLPQSPTPTPTKCCSDFQISRIQGFTSATYNVSSCKGQSGTFTYTGSSYITIQCATNVTNVSGASIARLPGCGCPTPPPTSTMTPTPVTQCSNIVFPNPQLTLNGITITVNRTGNTYLIPSSSPSIDFSDDCGFNFNVQFPTLLVGNGLNGIGITGPPSFFSNWSLSINFSQPITSITIALIDGGCACQYSPNDPENFWFTTNSGIPTITPIISCNSVINNNEIILRSTGPVWEGGETGNGVYTITNCNGFTNLTMTGDGGYLGSAFGICDTSVNPNQCVTPTPTPTLTKTPTKTPQSLNCNNTFIPPYSYKGVNSTFTSTGDAVRYDIIPQQINAFICGIIQQNNNPGFFCGHASFGPPTPASNFSLTFNFDLPINNIVIVAIV
jgi:hypothetical protein